MEFVGAGRGDTKTLRLRNRSEEYVAFKVKTTAPSLYTATPMAGVLRPNETLDVQVNVGATRESCANHKFLVQSCVVGDADASSKC